MHILWKIFFWKPYYILRNLQLIYFPNKMTFQLPWDFDALHTNDIKLISPEDFAGHVKIKKKFWEAFKQSQPNENEKSYLCALRDYLDEKVRSKDYKVKGKDVKPTIQFIFGNRVLL